MITSPGQLMVAPVAEWGRGASGVQEVAGALGRQVQGFKWMGGAGPSAEVHGCSKWLPGAAELQPAGKACRLTL